MTQGEFDVWRERVVREYAADHVAAGNWTAEESIAKSEGQLATALPDGLRSHNNHLWTVRDADEAPVGILWIATGLRPGHAFIYDIEMDSSRRGEGLGTATLLALEEWARGNGITTIGLHVFAHNEGARRLYNRLGYVETDVQMQKRL